jgi:hypothetical protein
MEKRRRREEESATIDRVTRAPREELPVGLLATGREPRSDRKRSTRMSMIPDGAETRFRIRLTRARARERKRAADEPTTFLQFLLTCGVQQRVNGGSTARGASYYYSPETESR